MLTVGPFGYCKGGPLAWSCYPDTGEDALILLDESGDRVVLTVNLWDPAPAETPPDHIWLKDWEALAGCMDALIAAGVATFSGASMPAGYCVSPLAQLTPAAIAERDEFLRANPDLAKARADARRAYAEKRTRQGVA